MLRRIKSLRTNSRLNSLSSQESDTSTCSGDIQHISKSEKVCVRNPNIDSMHADILYHFAMTTTTTDMKTEFGDVKFVIVGGSSHRMEKVALHFSKELSIAEDNIKNFAAGTDRFVLFKVGPILIASHGMGVPSISIMLNEIIKILYHAEAYNVEMFRIGTSGGIGVTPGTVVVSNKVLNGFFRPHYDLIVLGKKHRKLAILDQQMAREVLLESKNTDIPVVHGSTVCTHDFYEGQGRLDGAFCDYTEKDKIKFLKKAHSLGVRNIEMESSCFASMCHRAGIKASVVCVALLDRLNGDQVSTAKATLKQWELRPMLLVSNYVKRKLGLLQ